MSDSVSDLRRLATAYGVQTSYLDVHFQKQQASESTLRAVLAAMGAPLDEPGGAKAALAARVEEAWRRPVDWVLTAWDGRLKSVPLRVPKSKADGVARLEIRLEDGQSIVRDVRLAKAKTLKSADLGRESFLLKAAPLVETLPAGYHTLRVGFQRERSSDKPGHEALLISAPARSYAPGRNAARVWGLFAPLYSLHSQDSWGAGNFTDLERLWDFTAARGGSLVATLPLLATFLDQWGDPSPYSPASRLFWNEAYLDIDRIPELEICSEARELVQSMAFQAELDELRKMPYVDHMRKFALQRKVLGMLAECCLDSGGGRLAALQEFVENEPLVGEYARFRAIRETHGWDWPAWPAHLRSPQSDRSLSARELLSRWDTPAHDFDDAARRYHIYAQFLVHEQIGRLVAKAQGAGAGLYLDLPLGVNRFGFDTWLDPQAYAMNASGGAPPDEFFTKGQNWGFAPLHPEYLRRTGYRPFLGFLRRHMANAGMLRIDHVMMLHRLYWVPAGLDASQGAYVRYPEEELFALLSLESHRHRCRLAGENLGTVPPQVNRALKKHRVRQMFVVQYEAKPDADEALSEPPALSVASLNTHDMPPFASWWEGREFEDLAALGLFDEAGVKAAHAKRAKVRKATLRYLKAHGAFKKPPPQAQEHASAELHDAVLGWLAASDAETVLVNLEDLWQETKPQNTPGTFDERPNWRRKARMSLEEIVADPSLSQRLARINALRSG